MKSNFKKDNFIHPELKFGEVFFLNSDLACFKKFAFASKRLGKITYNGEGVRINHADWFPVFLSKKEVVDIENLKLIRRNSNIMRLKLNKINI